MSEAGFARGRSVGACWGLFAPALVQLVLASVIVPCLCAGSYAEQAESRDAVDSQPLPPPVGADPGPTETGHPPRTPDSATSQPATLLKPTLSDNALGGELLLFEEMPIVVTSASRTPQPICMSSAPVSVVTAEDIHYSGLTSLDEILQFYPGVDVLWPGRNHPALGIRGLHGVASERVLTLLDGMDVSDVEASAPMVQFLPIAMEDVDRVEIVRGPASAAWGANAFFGVINIITKEPEQCLGLTGSTTWNHFGDSYSFLRWAALSGKTSWKLSLNYQDIETSDEAIDDDNFTSDDWLRIGRFDGKLVHRPDGNTKLTAGVGYSRYEDGLVTIARPHTNRAYFVKPYVRLDRAFDDGSSGFVRWSGTLYSYLYPESVRHLNMLSDIDGQYDFSPAKAHKASVGGNVRGVYAEMAHGSAAPMKWQFNTDPLQEYSVGAFVIDHWALTDRLTIESQGRIDWYDKTGWDWSGRLTGLYALDAEDAHVLRLSAAKAFRVPSIQARRLEAGMMLLPSPPFPPRTYFVDLLDNNNLHNEEVWSLEAGYTGRLTDHLTAKVNGYYQCMTDMIGYAFLPDPLAAGRTVIQFANSGTSRAYGVETELEYVKGPGSLAMWYSWNAFVPNSSDQQLRAHLPSEHKAGLRGRVHLPDGWTGSADYVFVSLTDAGHMIAPNTLVTTPPPDVPASHRLDLTVAKELWDGHCELLFGVSDVLNTTRDPVGSVPFSSPHDTPGRTFFGRLQIRF